MSSSPDLESLALPPSEVSKTVRLPSGESTKPLSNSLRRVETEAKPSRELSSKDQAKVDMDEVYRRWSTFEEPDGMDATALYDEYGEALERYIRISVQWIFKSAPLSKLSKTFTNIPTGATIVVTTPYGFKVGPFDYTVSIGLGSYTGSNDDAYDDPWLASVVQMKEANLESPEFSEF